VRSEGSAFGRAARSELVAGVGASDRSPNQPASAQGEPGKHVLAVVAPHRGRGSGPVMRLLLRKAPDPHRHPTSVASSTMRLASEQGTRVMHAADDTGAPMLPAAAAARDARRVIRFWRARFDRSLPTPSVAGSSVAMCTPHRDPAATSGVQRRFATRRHSTPVDRRP
jgi:hypothetical protein